MVTVGCNKKKKKERILRDFPNLFCIYPFNLISRVKVLCNNVQEFFTVWGALYGSVW